MLAKLRLLGCFGLTVQAVGLFLDYGKWTIQVFHSDLTKMSHRVGLLRQMNVYPCDLENAFQWTQNVYDSWSMIGWQQGCCCRDCVNEINGEVMGDSFYECW